ncbi:hypothetical protein COY07_04785 [Candidatus Peregrinibacteria bacterium CG_4_10_14_0_2_um_filter_43_11]|nr:MAG: hypothetical protein COY07_04785 [Candidatus Peregrinibacteria bacterium CG_4_10_14_0_2_um_filter_43_11]
MLIDYHLHNHFSPDSQTETVELLKRAQDQGMREICITNHAEWFTMENWHGVFELNEAIQRFSDVESEIDHIQPQFFDIPIKLGTELTYSPDDLVAIEQFLGIIDFDFVLGSVHDIDDIIINSHKDEVRYFPGKSEEEAYLPYFQQLRDLAEWGQCDVIAHFDTIKKYGHKYYGPFEPEKYKRLIISVLEVMKKNGIGLEINSNCLHDKCQELFPHPTILKWALEVGIEYFTLGSDAHSPEEVSRHIAESMEMVKTIGLKQITTYEKRKPILHSI